jgi:hypothetical protein
VKKYKNPELRLERHYTQSKTPEALILLDRLVLQLEHKPYITIYKYLLF